MRRQGSIWTDTLPFILGLALLFGCFLRPAEVRAQRTNTKASAASGVLQAADPLNSAEGIGTPTGLKKHYTGKKISLDLMDADVRNVLRLLADLTGMNIVVEPDVTGKVTLKVEQVPWDQVLDMVLSMNDLGKEQVGNVIRIARESKLRKEYLQQAEAIKAKQSLAQATRDRGDLTTVYFPINFAQPSEIAAKIADGKSAQGKVSVDKRTSLIIYTDYPARIASARQLLQRLDRPTPQVLIEARIITLKSEAKRQLGVDLALLTHHAATSTSPATVPPFSGPVSPTSGTTTPTQDFFINPPLPGLSQFGANIFQLVGKTLLNIDLEIQALQTLSMARVVAAPRVLTLDNQKAVISQGIQVPYLTVGDTAANVTATSFKDAVLELQVTPHITPDRKIRMLINAKQDSVSQSVFSVGGSSEPGIDTRKIQTELLVNDGNVVVIGGVIDNESSHSNQSTPGLSNIPILGRLFKAEESDDSRNELLIFISPKIVEVSRSYNKT